MSEKIAFLGCGSMGEAILAGLLSGGVSPSSVTTTSRRVERAQELAQRYGITALAGAEVSDANVQATTGASVVVIGVKPNQVADLCKEISSALSADAVVVSVAGGVTVDQIERHLPKGQPVVRTMPNTPLMVGRGVVGIAGGHSAAESDVAAAARLFENPGTVLRVPEDKMDAVGAISGSGPAYFFYIAEALAHAAEGMGFDKDTARVLAQNTAVGAGAMLAEPNADAEALRIAVTSPKGSTERAIAAFDEHGIPAAINAGAQAALARSAEVSAELNEQQN